MKGQPTSYIHGHTGRWKPPFERFLKRIKPKTNGCIEWQGFLANGYGHISVQNNIVPVHRFIYEMTQGQIPVGKQIDHLCRNRRCVNPEHLEVVTQRENLLRGVSPCATNSKKVFCKHGHPFDKANTGYSLYRTIRKHRYCRTCARLKQRRYTKAHS